MDEVNLLPWREQKIMYERAILARYVLFVVLFALLLLGACHVWFAALNARHEQRLSVLQSQLPDAGEGVEQAESAEVATLSMDLFTALSATRTQGVCYSKLEYSDHRVTLSGQAFTYTGLLQALTQLNTDANIGKLYLLSGKQEKSGSPLQFVINAGEW